MKIVLSLIAIVTVFVFVGGSGAGEASNLYESRSSAGTLIKSYTSILKPSSETPRTMRPSPLVPHTSAVATPVGETQASTSTISMPSIVTSLPETSVEERAVLIEAKEPSPPAASPVKTPVPSQKTREVKVATPAPKRPAPTLAISAPSTRATLPEASPEQVAVPVEDEQPSPAPVMIPEEVSSPPQKTGEVKWSCDFEGSYCGFYEQSKVEPEGRRSSFVSVTRSGTQAVKLTTLPGDDEVHGSGYWERNDLQLPATSGYCNEGQEEWWAMSVLFPDDYTVPKEGGAVMDFHHNASGGQANFHFLSQPTGLRMHGFYGDVKNPTEYRVELGPVTKNKWYDLVYHVKWTSEGEGLFTAWMNGKKVLDHKGPTLYKGISCYLKLANYHDPLGVPSSIVFDRVLRGTSATAVALGALEGLE